MSLAMVVAGVLGQLFLGFSLFMLAIFAGGGVANGNSLAGWQMSILNASMFVLPGLSAVSIILLIHAWLHQGSASANWWHLLPLAGTAIYIAFVLQIGGE